MLGIDARLPRAEGSSGMKASVYLLVVLTPKYVAHPS